MARLLLILLTGTFLLFTSAYETDPPDTHELPWTFIEGNKDWMRIKHGIEISATEIISTHQKDLGLGDSDALQLYRTETDGLGYTHYRFQQLYKNVPVEGGELLIHELENQVQTLNGKIISGIAATVIPQLSAEAAIAIALNEVGASQYLWESKKAEDILKELENDPDASFYPKAELVLVDPAFELNPEDFELAYRLEVQAQRPLAYRLFYINALSGDILQNINLLHESDTPALALTKYDGEQMIVTDSIAPDTFLLRELSRGGGVFTYNMHQQTDYELFTDFMDADNYWENDDSTDLGVATSAHWGAENTFDYLLAQHNYIGIDNNSMPLISFVNYDVNYVNAFWNGRWATFGNGDGARTALTSLDVVAHEFTHGVTRSTANLLYYKESGGLNESFSDIIGESVESFAKQGERDWLVGADFHTAAGDAFRSMSNPNAEGDPDTYKGMNWVSSAGDNYGVHSNSGVQNYWFYLLTEGGNGTNDIGDEFEVPALGMEKAASIAFRNLQYYLVRLSQYRDARLGTLIGAEDLYGLCSPEVEATAMAWHAVGVGQPIRDFDIQPVALEGLSALECGIADTTFLTLQIRYNGCAATIEAGTEIPFAYRINGTLLVEDTLLLAEALNGGDLLSVELGPITAFAAEREHRILVWTKLAGDSENNNDTIRLDIANPGNQSFDIALAEIQNPESACMLDAEDVRVLLRFLGCDSLPAQSMIEVGFRLNNGLTVTDSLIIEAPLFYGDEISHVFEGIYLNLSANGEYAFDAWARYAPDTLTANNTIDQFMVTHPKPKTIQEVIDFDSGESGSYWYTANALAEAQIVPEVGVGGSAALRLSGSDFIDNAAYETWPYDREDQIFSRFSAYRSKVCFCADLTNLSVAVLRYEIKQTLSPYHQAMEGLNTRLFSIARLTIDGEEKGGELMPSLNGSANYRMESYFFGTSYLGQVVEICIESVNALHKDFDPFGIGDNTYLDNILLVGLIVDVEEPELVEQEVRIFPNPAKGAFQVSMDRAEAGELKLQLFNTMGQVVRQDIRSMGSGSQTFSIDVADLPAGVYTLQLEADGQRSARKVLINN